MERCVLFYEKILAFYQKSRRNKRLVYYGIYTALFSIVAAIVFSWFYTNGKSFIWTSDGLPQHFTALVYYGEYLREIFSGLLAGNLSIPLWDFSIGFGSDIMATLGNCVMGDPLFVLSAFFKPEHTEWLYNALIVLRLYLAGIAFSAYCVCRGKRRAYTLIGAFIYVFCGFALFAAVRHPYFTNPMIYFPLIFL